jgi:hypothetical protein
MRRVLTLVRDCPREVANHLQQLQYDRTADETTFGSQFWQVASIASSAIGVLAQREPILAFGTAFA